MHETAYKQRIVDYLRGKPKGSEGGILAYDLYKQGWEPQRIINNLGELNKEGSRYLLVKLNSEEQPLFFDLMDMSFLCNLQGVPVYLAHYLINNYQKRDIKQKDYEILKIAKIKQMPSTYRDSSIVTHLLKNAELYDEKIIKITEQQVHDLKQSKYLRESMSMVDKDVFEYYLSTIVVPQELLKYKHNRVANEAVTILLRMRDQLDAVKMGIVSKYTSLTTSKNRTLLDEVVYILKNEPVFRELIHRRVVLNILLEATLN